VIKLLILPLSCNSSHFQGHNSIYKAYFQCPCFTENWRENCCIYKKQMCLFYSKRGLHREWSREKERKQCILWVRIIFSSGQANWCNR